MPLLEVLFTEEVPLQKGTKTLVDSLIEFPVNPMLSPFLVSSLTHATWVEKVSQGSTIRAAFRPVQDLEVDFIQQIVERGQIQQWGNIHAFTVDGCNQCLNHLKFFGFRLEDLQVLVSSDLPWDLPVQIVVESWVPTKTAIFVPKDLSFVGSQVFLGTTKVAAVVHNAGRGIAIAVGA